MGMIMVVVMVMVMVAVVVMVMVIKSIRVIFNPFPNSMMVLLMPIKIITFSINANMPFG